MKRIIKTVEELELRNDPAGEGHYGASRGARTHNGIDYVVRKGDAILSPVAGYVSKHGYPYGDDLKWRYIEISDSNDYRHRFFYVQPKSEISAIVEADHTVIGYAQDVSERYPGQEMTPHLHYEIMFHDDYVDPGEFWA